MKNTLLAILIFVSFLTHAQKSQTIEGKWMMDQLIQNDEDVTIEHNPESDRYIIFFSNGTFKSGGSPYGENTGSYFYEATSKVLELDSDAGEEDDSKWKVDFEDGMKWQGIGSEWAEGFIILYKKAE